MGGVEYIFDEQFIFNLKVIRCNKVQPCDNKNEWIRLEVQLPTGGYFHNQEVSFQNFVVNCHCEENSDEAIYWFMKD